MSLRRFGALVTSLVLLFTACATMPSGPAADGAIAVGSQPDFQLPRVPEAEGTITLSELRGQVVIVDFWASWCAPCKEAMPFYAELQARHPDGLRILGVNVDEDTGAMETALREGPPGITILRDADSTVVSAFGVRTMPTSFVLDREGKVVLVHRGFVPSDRAKLTTLVEDLLAR